MSGRSLLKGHDLRAWQLDPAADWSTAVGFGWCGAVIDSMY